MNQSTIPLQILLQATTRRVLFTLAALILLLSGTLPFTPAYAIFNADNARETRDTHGHNTARLPSGLRDAIRAALGPPDRPARYPTAQQAQLTAADRATNDYFGNEVALSADGNTALIGAYQEDDGATTNNGAAYVFTRSGTTWTQQAKLLAADKANDDNFGRAVALSADGNTALIGANLEDDSGTTDNGAAYVFTRSGTTWTQQAKLLATGKAANDTFGGSVALSADGNTALIGASGNSDSGLSANGAAFVFTRSGVTWTQQAKLLAQDKASADFFGQSVALSANGNTALIGAFQEDDGGATNNGAGYVFTRSGSVWSQQAKLTALDKANNDSLGVSAALSADGSLALLGAYQKTENGVFSAGAAYLFVRIGSTWAGQAKLTASDKASSDNFGRSVALASGGSIAVIGATGTDDSGTTANGAVYVFTRTGATWTQQTKLLASDKASNDSLGGAVAVSFDGNTGLAGAIGVEISGGQTDHGAAYAFYGAAAVRPDTIGVYKNGSWSMRNVNTPGTAQITATFGGDASDLPIVGDWDGDGIDTIGVYRSSTGVVLLSNSNTSPSVVYSLVFGNPGDTPFAGRWEASLTHDGVGVYRPSNGILYQKKDLTTGFSDYFAIFGNPGDQGVAGDWDGNGLDSIGIYRPTGTRWYMTNNSGPTGITYSDIDFAWAIGTSYALAGDWDGDGITTPGYLTTAGVFTLHSVNAAGGIDTSFAFGPTGARPVAGKWTLTVAPLGPVNNGLDGLLVEPPRYVPPTPVPGFE